jgi:hypothetical protein
MLQSQYGGQQPMPYNNQQQFQQTNPQGQFQPQQIQQMTQQNSNNPYSQQVVQQPQWQPQLNQPMWSPQQNQGMVPQSPSNQRIDFKVNKLSGPTIKDMTRDDYLNFGYIPGVGTVCCIAPCIQYLCLGSKEWCLNCCSCCLNPAQKEARRNQRSINIYEISRNGYRCCNYSVPCLGRCMANCFCGNDLLESYITAMNLRPQQQTMS